MKYVISGPPGPVKDTIRLPSSKSISNRLLVLCALEGRGRVPGNLSVSDDTRVLRNALRNGDGVCDIGHAGTAMRFLTAYFCTGKREVVLTGSDRMKERPVGPLVEALRMLGARIEYLEKEGTPPLKISGGLQGGGRVSIPAGISSQFISALMMIGPALRGGLQIDLKGDLVSGTYLRMTRALMQQGGIEARITKRSIRVPEGRYHFGDVHVEPDWSAASYWYETAAMLPGSEIRLPGLSGESLQGDAVLPDLFRPLGVNSAFEPEGLLIRSEEGPAADRFGEDMTGSPDLVQTLVPTLCSLSVPFRLTGTHTLRIKETDRIHALQEEMKKLGFLIRSDPPGNWITWDGQRGQTEKEPVIRTYHDHRMAMALAPLSSGGAPLIIDDPLVVTKSYPSYWKDLEKLGFRIEEKLSS